MRVAEESFGDAILSIYPMQLIKKDALARLQHLSFLETRGALWVQIEVDSQRIQVVNTHLGLHAAARFRHAEELLSDQWISHPKCRCPVILCGDFNTMPGSKTFKRLNSRLRSVQACLHRKQYKRTWCGRYPVACVDHIFAGGDIQVVDCQVGDTFLARLASDHRPVITDVRLPG
jgi:endonuclease/exonuclease/phosphatase family metal-dependent hydrolase